MIEHMLRDKASNSALSLGEEFEMSIGYQPNGSNYHDHLCNCPGCNYDGPEPTDQEVLEMVWSDLQAVPSYVEQQAAAWAAELALPIEQ